MLLTSRRAFVATVTGGLFAWPYVGHSQPALAAIGFLSSRAPAPNGYLATAFRQGLTEGGYVDGRNVVIEYRWADGRHDRLPALAADLVRRQVAVIAAISGTPAAVAAKAATRAIPIVFANGGDPIRSGLVTRLNRPAENITGVTFLTTALAGKRLELIHELMPTLSAIGFLVKPNNPAGAAEIADANAAARTIGLQLRVLEATSAGTIDVAFTTLVQRRVGAVIIGSDPFFGDSSSQLVELAARHAVPTLYFSREFVEAGGLMSYGSSQTDAYHQAGVYTARILKGAKPADLPVLQPSRFELVINLKTAKALRLTIPRSVLVRADQTIE
jgi:putative ABC transport system substrate-binding protein